MEINRYPVRFLFRLMKRSVYQLLIVCLFVSLGTARPSGAQEVLNRPVTIQALNQELKVVLAQLHQQADVRFTYSPTLIPVGRRVSYSATNQRLADVMDALFSPFAIGYRVEGRRVVLYKAEKPTSEVVAPPPAVALPTDPAKAIVLKGRITSETGEGLPGVSVLLKNTSTGTASDALGDYALSLPDASAGGTLVFSFIGYIPQEIPIASQSVINVQLVPSNNSLNEVVVVGYGTQRRSDLTSAVASVKAENFVKGAVTDAGQLLQGKVAGLNIGTPSGDPTATTQILLRGTSTLNASNQPLILVDGIPGDLRTVAPEDIASIDVLKDGSAAAIYGTRGTNGVILITTRRANGNIEPSIQYDGYVSTQTILKRPQMLTATDYRNLIKQGVPFEDLGSDTDWIDAVTRTPVSHVHNLTLRGGNAKTNYLANLSYRGFEGILQKSDNRSLIGRLDINHNMFDNRLRFNANVINNNNNYTTTGDGYSFNGLAYRQALIRNPTSPVKNPDGTWFEQPGIYVYENPLARLYESTGENKSQTTRLSGSVTWEPADGLLLKALVSQNRFNELRGYAESKRHISTIRDSRNGYASRGTTERTDRLLELTAQYDRALGAGRLSVLGGYSFQDFAFEDYYMQNFDFPTDKFTYNNIGTGNALKLGTATINSNKTLSNLIGFFGRATYNYKDKYLLLASLRYEASSKLVGAAKPWGAFPAVSVGWRINREGFMSNVSFVNDLKLRAGYGVTGTVPDPLFLGVSRLGYSGNFLVNGQWVQTLLPVSNPNPNLRWEEKQETNIGLDFSLFKSRVSGTLDVYRRRTNGLLFDYPVPTPPNLYNITTANVGVMENKGIELLVNVAAVQKRNVTWNTGVNVSTNANKLVSLSNDQYQSTNDFFDTGYTGEPIQTTTHRVQVGQRIGNFYGYKVVDVSDDGRWIYEDKAGERSPDKGGQDNKQVLGNGLPRYYAGWNNTVQYKNVDLSVTMRGAFAYQILNFQRMYYEVPGVAQYNQLKSAQEKVFGKAVLNKNEPLEYTSYYVENGDFWKIDNITLGHNFRLTKGNVLKNARVYAALLNAYTFTGYKGIDPEVNRLGLAPGNDDRDKYPSTRTYTLGLNLTF